MIGSLVSGFGRRILAELSREALRSGRGSIHLRPILPPRLEKLNDDSLIISLESYYSQLGFVEAPGRRCFDSKLFWLRGEALKKLAQESV